MTIKSAISFALLLCFSSITTAEIIIQIDKAQSFQAHLQQQPTNMVDPNIKITVGYNEIFDVEHPLTFNIDSQSGCSRTPDTSNPALHSSRYSSGKYFVGKIDFSRDQYQVPLHYFETNQQPITCQYQWNANVYDRNTNEYLFFIGQPLQFNSSSQKLIEKSNIELLPEMISRTTVVKPEIMIKSGLEPK